MISKTPKAVDKTKKLLFLIWRGTEAFLFYLQLLGFSKSFNCLFGFYTDKNRLPNPLPLTLVVRLKESWLFKLKITFEEEV